MIIWSGFGFIVPVIVLGAMCVAQLAVNDVMGGDYYSRHAWPRLAACVIAAIVLWFSGRRMNKPSGQLFVDLELGGGFQTRPNHSFFFMPVQYWSFVVIPFGLIMEFAL